MKKEIYYILLFVIIVLVSHKPINTLWKDAVLKDVAKELKDMQLAYTKITTYSVNINYLTFDTKNDGEIHDKSKGYFIKSGVNCKSRLLGIFSVQNEKFRVTIDSSNKLIQVTNAFEFKDPGFSLNDYIKILNVCKAVKRSNENNRLGYRFETKNKEGVMAQEIFIENGITKEVDVYYANENFLRENNSIKKEIVYPRLQVIFSDYNQKITFSKSEFSLEKIFSINRDKKIKLTPGYKGYKLIDGRIKK